VIPIEELRDWLSSHEWKPGTYNRYRTVLSLIYRLGIENKKINSNPSQLLKRQKESDGRVRFLNQHAHDEELRLRKVIALKYPNRMSEFDIGLSTGMRRSEQYSRIKWGCVDLSGRDLPIPGSKSGKSRHIPLNSAAVAAFEEPKLRTGRKDPIFASRNHGGSLRGARHWFEDAIREAGLTDFTWHDLRHTFASRLVMTGTDLRTVAEPMGHATIQMTMRYRHLQPVHKQAAVDRLSFFGVAVQAKPTDAKTSTKQNRQSKQHLKNRDQVTANVLVT